VVQSNAWMTSELMLLWVRRNFLQYINRGRTDHALLILDGTFNQNNVRALRLPPNTTAMIQPLDVGVNHPFKMRLVRFWTNWMNNQIASGAEIKLPKK